MRSGDECVETLQSAGIPAARVLDGLDLIQEPRMLGGTMVSGPDGVLAKGMPYRIVGATLNVQRPAPQLGQHTDEVLRDILGLPADEVERLARRGVISARPAGHVTVPPALVTAAAHGVRWRATERALLASSTTHSRKAVKASFLGASVGHTR